MPFQLNLPKFSKPPFIIKRRLKSPFFFLIQLVCISVSMHVLPRQFECQNVLYVGLLVFNHCRTCNHKNSMCVASSMCYYIIVL